MCDILELVKLKINLIFFTLIFSLNCPFLLWKTVCLSSSSKICCDECRVRVSVRISDNLYVWSCSKDLRYPIWPNYNMNCRTLSMTSSVIHMRKLIAQSFKAKQSCVVLPAKGKKSIQSLISWHISAHPFPLRENLPCRSHIQLTHSPAEPPSPPKLW